MDTKQISPALVREKYPQAVSAFRRTLASPALAEAFSREADSFFRAAALGVWARDDDLSDAHVDVYNAIYSGQGPAPHALYFQLSAAVAAPPPFTPPAFFYSLVTEDAQKGGGSAKRFIDLFTLFMTLFASVSGSPSPAQREYISACAAHLTALAEGRPVPAAPAAAAQPAAEQSAPAQEEEPPDAEALLAELDSLCGMDKIKKDVRSLINLVKVRTLREAHGLPLPPLSLHMVFLGNPGTGKTTVARLLAKLYHAIGVLSKGQLVEVDRSGLVAGYVGQTALKTGEVLQSALGGVLFIDEAYALTDQTGGNDFGKEAIEVLLKGMEDHRRDLIVIVAGYSGLMEDFIHSNPGLESRFNKYFYFEDYTGPQLYEIFLSLCKKNGYDPEEPAKEWARDYLDRLYAQRDENFGNARTVRNLFETAVARQSDRLSQLDAPTKEELMTLTAEDLRRAAGEEA